MYVCLLYILNAFCKVTKLLAVKLSVVIRLLSVS